MSGDWTGDPRVGKLDASVMAFYKARLEDAKTNNYGTELEHLIQSTIDHTRHVLGNVPVVCEKIGSSPVAIDFAAALCHDLDRVSYQRDFPEYTSLEKPAWFSLKNGGHGILSSLMCGKYLDKAGFFAPEKSEIIASIAVHDDRFVTKGMGYFPFVLIMSDKLDRFGDEGARRLYENRRDLFDKKLGRKLNHEEAVRSSKETMNSTLETLKKMDIPDKLLQHMMEKYEKGNKFLASFMSYP